MSAQREVELRAEMDRLVKIRSRVDACGQGDFGIGVDHDKESVAWQSLDAQLTALVDRRRLRPEEQVSYTGSESIHRQLETTQARLSAECIRCGTSPGNETMSNNTEQSETTTADDLTELLAYRQTSTATLELLNETVDEANHQLDALRAAVRSLLPLADMRARALAERPLSELEYAEAKAIIRAAEELTSKNGRFRP